MLTTFDRVAHVVILYKLVVMLLPQTSSLRASKKKTPAAQMQGANVLKACFLFLGHKIYVESVTIS
jgi:hypothetical protein